MRATNLRRLLLIAAAGTSSACTADRITSPVGEDVARRVNSLGFSAVGLRDYGDYVVVEGDIRLEKSALFSAGLGPEAGKTPPGHPAYQYNTNQLVSSTYVRQILVNLGNIAAASDWASAARNAMADYNSSGSAVHMAEGSPADITFSSINQFGDPNVIAQASFPYQGSPSGKPGPTITVAENYDTLTVGQKEKVLVHEFGHTLGLRHDNAAATEGDGGIGANLVYGTPTSDPGSVMVTPYNGSVWSGFDSYDVVALKTLYNPIVITISGPTTVANGRWCRWTANPSGGVPPYTYSWQVQQPASSYFSPNSSLSQTLQTSGNNFTGSFYITITVTDGTSWSNTVATYVTDTGFGGSYDPTYCT